MKTIFKIALGVVGLLMIPNAFAGVTCEGKIQNVYKWFDRQTLSIQVATLEGLTNWIRMPTQSDESMALTAFASGKAVQVRWEGNLNITKCIDGWPNNTEFEGWWLIKG
ncbi:hypothetical protein L4174_006790 [Photobacterium sp. CCB-ST2H9]|uniref:hypothetical protein n=1 Tax=Photobacterium sp. CCB-ST2H9 TaxID=2912855 RepID=UPI002004B2FE|nr:hypothetical protein [Photobacterium sp. CCB-ST2H9]UTM58536.1 hypothetical protein L4174_006790 [Photobacterium sp. CCB-ST2H9]